MPREGSGEPLPTTMTLWAGRSLVSETRTLSLSPVLLPGRAAHLNDPYVEVPVTLNVREAPPGVHPRSGGSERGNTSRSPQARVAAPRHPGPLGSKQELSPPTALQSPFIMARASHEEGCVNTSSGKRGQVLQMSAQRLCTQGPSLWSVFALLKKG